MYLGITIELIMVQGLGCDSYCYRNWVSYLMLVCRRCIMLSRICEMHPSENGPCDEVQTSGFWGCISIPSLLGLVYSCPTTAFEWSRGCHQRASILPSFIFVLFQWFCNHIQEFKRTSPKWAHDFWRPWKVIGKSRGLLCLLRFYGSDDGRRIPHLQLVHNVIIFCDTS